MRSVSSFVTEGGSVFDSREQRLITLALVRRGSCSWGGPKFGRYADSEPSSARYALGGFDFGQSSGCKDHVTHRAEWLFTFVRPTFSVRYTAEGRFARCGGLKQYEGLAKDSASWLGRL